MSALTALTVHFRCACGRSVATERGTATGEARRCSRCLEREIRPRDDLRR